MEQNEQHRVEQYPEIMTPVQAADFLQISRFTLDRMTKAGSIPVCRIGQRIVRYKRDRLLALLDASQPD
jgi:excisionase family DNA binding protein